MASNQENIQALRHAVAVHQQRKTMKAPMSEFIADYLQSGGGGELISAVLRSRGTGQPITVTHNGVTRSFVPVSRLKKKA